MAYKNKDGGDELKRKLNPLLKTFVSYDWMGVIDIFWAFVNNRLWRWEKVKQQYFSNQSNVFQQLIDLIKNIHFEKKIFKSACLHDTNVNQCIYLLDKSKYFVWDTSNSTCKTFCHIIFWSPWLFAHFLKHAYILEKKKNTIKVLYPNSLHIRLFSLKMNLSIQIFIDWGPCVFQNQFYNNKMCKTV